MDGFPMTVNQAKLLEKALTGRDPVEEQAVKSSLRKPILVVDPATPKEPPVFPPALDFVLLLDISDSDVLNRVTTRKCEFSVYNISKQTLLIDTCNHTYYNCMISN